MTDPSIEVRVTPNFERSLKRLSKKYRRIGYDVDPLIQKLRSGEKPGDQIPGVGFTVYKERLPNRDAQAGKSGGYRVIYYILTESTIYLLEIYAKTEQTDIPLEHIRRIISEEITAPPTAED